MAGKVKQIVTEKINPIIEDLGYSVVDVEFSKLSDGMNLIFYIDNDKGVTIEDCEKVSRLIDPILDQLNPTDDKPYVLSVSSPGIDRPLKSKRDFERNLGKEIEVTLFSKLNGKKVYSGVLKSFSDEEVVLTQEGNDIVLNREKIAHIVPIIKF